MRASGEANPVSLGAPAAPGADAVDERVFRGRVVSIGRFRCRPDHAHWDREERIRSGHIIVFPRTFVRITQTGRAPIVTILLPRRK